LFIIEKLTLHDQVHWAHDEAFDRSPLGTLERVVQRARRLDGKPFCSHDLRVATRAQIGFATQIATHGATRPMTFTCARGHQTTLAVPCDLLAISSADAEFVQDGGASFELAENVFLSVRPKTGRDEAVQQELLLDRIPQLVLFEVTAYMGPELVNAMRKGLTVETLRVKDLVTDPRLRNRLQQAARLLQLEGERAAAVKAVAEAKRDGAEGTIPAERIAEIEQQQRERERSFVHEDAIAIAVTADGIETPDGAITDIDAILQYLNAHVSAGVLEDILREIDTLNGGVPAPVRVKCSTKECGMEWDQPVPLEHLLTRPSPPIGGRRLRKRPTGTRSGSAP
jgi:chorismate mutase